MEYNNILDKAILVEDQAERLAYVAVYSIA